MVKKWVTIFERYEDFHFDKDVGQLAYHAKVTLNYNVELWCKKGEHTLKKQLFKIKELECGAKNTKVSFRVIWHITKNARKIDYLNIFHFRIYSLVYAFFYKVINPRGKVILKCDGSERCYPYNDNKLKNRLLFYFLKKIKLINIFLAEHLSLVEYYKSKGLPALFCPNGTSPAYYSCKLPVKSNIVPTIIFVGTCGDDRKNAKLAVEAVSKLKFDCRIFFLGGETELFNKWFKKWSIGKPHDVIQRYIFCGYVNDVSRIIHYYDEAHVFLMTSVHEGYPLSLAQAAWRGCYPILSEGSGGGDMNIAGCAAIFHNEESLIDILDKSLSNLSATIAKGKKSRLYALNNNDWRLIIRKIEELI